MSQRTAYDYDSSSQVSESARSNYQTIERILKNENGNLKKQNDLLLNEIQRLKASNRRYKDNCLGQRVEVQALREESEAQKKRADDMKEIIMSRLMSLELKALGSSDGLSAEEREDLIHALNGSQTSSPEDKS